MNHSLRFRHYKWINNSCYLAFVNGLSKASEASLADIVLPPMLVIVTPYGKQLLHLHNLTELLHYRN